MLKQSDIAGAIIAGGTSRRMNSEGIIGDKFLHLLGKQTIIELVAQRMAQQLDTLFVNANGDPARLDFLCLPVIADIPHARGGPLVGLLSALSYAENHRFLLSAAADTPFLPTNLCQQLVERQTITQARIVLAKTKNQIHPIFGLWDTDLHKELNNWLSNSEQSSIIGFAEHIGFEVVEFPEGKTSDGAISYDSFFNINYRDDFIEAGRIHKAMK